MKKLELAQQAARADAVGGIRQAARYVGSRKTREDDIGRVEVPAKARVAVLELVAHERDLAER